MDLALKEIRAQISLLSQEIISGAPADLAEYRRLTGKVEGLMMAERIVLEFMQEDAD